MIKNPDIFKNIKSINNPPKKKREVLKDTIRIESEIDYEKAELLASLFLTIREIANVLDVSETRLKEDKKFMKVFNRGTDKGKTSLKRKQFELAMQGDRQMLIWLGKQYLGQSEKNINLNKNEDVIKIINPLKNEDN